MVLPMVFIIRASVDAEGAVQGVLQVASSGRKEAFADAAQLADLIRTLVVDDTVASTGLGRLQEL